MLEGMMECWRNGNVEGTKCGRMNGGLEDWRNGNLEYRKSG